MDGLDRLHSDIRAVRAQLPDAHRLLLDELRVQDKLVVRWPEEIRDLYATLLHKPPTPSALAGAAAVWLHRLRTVAFNAGLLLQARAGLTDASARALVAQVAWHEYGHALSLTRATKEHRDRGPELLELLPPGLRQAIDFPGRYRRSEVLDEIVATLYSVLMDNVRADGYVQPEYLHPEVFAVFEEIVPWPRTR